MSKICNKFSLTLLTLVVMVVLISPTLVFAGPPNLGGGGTTQSTNDPSGNQNTNNPGSTQTTNNPGSTQTTNNPTGSGSLTNPINAKSIAGLVKTILEGAIKILIPVVALAIIYSGFLFVAARGNVEKLKTAKQAITYSLIGAALILGAWAIAQMISETVLAL